MKLAVWGHPATEFPEGRDSTEHIRDWLGQLRGAGITQYMPFVLSGGKALFGVPALPAPERDLLARVLDVARPLGLAVHPIFGLGAVFPAAAPEQGRYVPLCHGDEEQIPGYAVGNACAAWPENIDFICTVVRQLLDRYPVDGLHMDYTRYPNADWFHTHPCICERCRAGRRQWLGHDVPTDEDLALSAYSYLEIKMRGQFVRRLPAALREICDERSLPLSLAARARYLKDAVAEGQDWAEWARDGLLDEIMPMSYNPCFERFTRFVEQHVRLLKGADKTVLLPGIGRKSSLGTQTPQQMAAQLEYVRECALPGACIFHAKALGAEDLSLLRQFARD